MNLVLTGATGFVGGEVLRQLTTRTDVQDVTCLSRRPLPAAASSAKVQVILATDFSRHDDDLAAHFADHDGCIWALGGKASDSKNDPAAYERATYGFTLAFARAVAPRLTRSFRFCYVSGMGVDPTESSWFPWEKRTRYLKGRVERHLSELTASHPLFRATAFRPAGILPRSTGTLTTALLAPIVVRVDQLAAALIDEAVTDSPTPFRVVTNREIKKQHRAPA